MATSCFFSQTQLNVECYADQCSPARFQVRWKRIDCAAVDTPQRIDIAAATARLICGDFREILTAIAHSAHRTVLHSVSESTLEQALAAREQVAPTSMPEGVAFPHAICAEINPNSSGLVIVTLAKPIPWASHRVGIVVGLFGSPTEPWLQVRRLARLARVLSQVDVRQRLIECTDDSSLLALFDRECNNYG